MTTPVSGISNAMTGMLILQGASLVGGIISGIAGYYTAQIIQESNARIAERGYANKDKLGQIDRDTKMALLGSQEKQQKIMADGGVKYNNAVEERKKAEDGKKIMDAKIAQLKLNAKAGKIRSQHAYGSPLAVG